MKRFRFGQVFVFIFVSTRLVSQSLFPLLHPLLRDRNVWVNGGGIWCYIPADPNNSAFILNGGVLRAVNPPQRMSSAYTFGFNKIWTIDYREEASGVEKLNLVAQDIDSSVDHWDKMGLIENNYGTPLSLYPLRDSGLFLGFNLLSGFVKDGKASYAACFKLREGKIIFDHCVDMPVYSFESVAKFYTENGKCANREACLPVHAFLQPNLLSIVQNDDYVFVASTKLGLIWIFNLTNGNCIKNIQLNDIKYKDVNKLEFIDHYILGMEPLKNGDILVATRQPEVVRAAMAIYDGVDQNSVLEKKYRSEYLEVVKDLRDVSWIRVDGESLTWKKDESFPTAWRFDYKSLKNFRFLDGPNGEVLYNVGTNWHNILEKFKLIHLNNKNK